MKIRMFASSLALSALICSQAFSATISPVISALDYDVDTPFWVEIRVTDVTNLFGAGFTLEYDNSEYIGLVTPSWMFTPVQPGDFLGSDVVVQFGTPEDGKISFSISRKKGAGGASGSGLLVKFGMEFDKYTPMTVSVNFSLSDVYATDPSANSIPLSTSTDSVGVTDATNTIGVWPGDADNSFYVDQADILPIGQLWHKTCPARSPASCAWSQQSAPPWIQTDVVHADCDGSGTVDQGDVLALGLNWHKSVTLLASAAEHGAVGSIGLDLSAFQVGLGPVGEGGGLYELSLSLDPAYAGEVKGISFSVSGLGGAGIISVDKGPAWSQDAIFFCKTSDGNWGVGITETPASFFRTGSELCLARIVFSSSSGLDLSEMIALSDLHVSLATGEILELETSGLFSRPAGAASMPKASALGRNLPNPFNPSTTINYSVAESSLPLSIGIYNLRGSLVRTLVHRVSQAGDYTVTWDGTYESGTKAGSGVYFYRMRLGDKTMTRKMVLLK